MRHVFTNIIMLFVLLLATETSAQRVMPTVKIYGDFGLSYTKGTIVVCDPDSIKPDTFDMYAKFRGGTSIAYEKKNFAVKLVDSTGAKRTEHILGMRNDNSWILDAMAVDKARMRNRVAFDIWNAMDVKPYYYEKEPKVKTGIRGRFVELYVNDNYNGLYCLNEKIDRKQLKLKKMENDVVHGVLYKGIEWNGTGFADPPDEYSNDNSVYQSFESVYPDVEDNGRTEWWPLVEKELFVVNASNEVFAEKYATHFDAPMLMNIHILINSVSATDNKGKNQFFYIYDIKEDKKMSFAPWDMDASFGRSWKGDIVDDATTSLYYESNLIKRIKAVDSTFMYNTAKRYFKLRNTVLASDSIKSRFDNYFQLFKETGSAKRECDKWGGVDGIDLDFDDEKNQLHDFIDDRMAFLDEYYGTFYDTAVKDIKCNQSEYDDNKIYDIYGRCISNLQPGHIYIINGKGVYIMK